MSGLTLEVGGVVYEDPGIEEEHWYRTSISDPVYY